MSLSTRFVDVLEALSLSLVNNRPRRLYNQEYLSAGCPVDQYDESTKVDDIFWTYTTNYFIAGIAILLAATLSAILLWQIYRFKARDELLLGQGGREEEPSEAEPKQPISGDSLAELPCPTTKTTSFAALPFSDDEDGKPFIRGFPINFSTQYYAVLIFYFVFLALGYGVAGAGHQVVTDSSSTQKDMFERAAAVLLGIAACLWVGVGMLEYIHAIKGHDEIGRVFQYLWLLVSVGCVTVLAVLNWMFLLGVAIFTSVLIILVMALWQYKRYRHAAFLSDCVATLVYAGGLIVQFVLSKVCGDDGYQDCFRDCPLPNPSKFNHNALFHLLVCAFLVQYGLTKVFILYKVTASPLPAKKAVVQENYGVSKVP